MNIELNNRSLLFYDLKNKWIYKSANFLRDLKDIKKELKTLKIDCTYTLNL